ncbi:MAG TPA: hypothetical protein VGX96_10360 [Candidatus Elarobacter sp.]|jgi:hypothetical protein|nr:hypothetical protein [Candidatus Elarobacter sp.]
MRTTLLSVLVIVVGAAALVQAAPAKNPAVLINPGFSDGVRAHPPAAHCCREKVWDKNGKEVGDLISYDNSYGGQPMIGWIAYRLKGGDAVLLHATPDALYGLVQPGGSNTLFTTPDCSGNTLFQSIAWPPLAKRYAAVTLEGGGSYPTISAVHAWLWVTDPLPARVIPGPGTVFHSQWYDNQTCQAYPAPGFTATSQPGGFWMHRVEDMYAKFKRPFYIDH